MGLRPMRSLMALLMSKEKASDKVDIDKTQLLCAGLSANCRASEGISGCMLYNSEKVEKPPKIMARVICRNAGVPAAMRAGWFICGGGVVLATVMMVWLDDQGVAILYLRFYSVQYIFKALVIHFLDD